MDFFSRGLQNEEAIDIPLVVMEDYFDPVPRRFRLILIRSGSGIVTIDGIKAHFFAPCILCVSDDIQTITYKSELKIHTREMVFHPLFINPDYGQVDSEVLWIQAFIKRSRDYFGLIQLDTLSFHRIDGLMSTLKQVLNQTADEFWPCRARSYLLESLLIVDRLYLQQFEDGENRLGLGRNRLPEASPLVNDLLDYLHTHYEEEISLESLSKIFHINRTTLNQMFKQTMSMPITQYLIELRMQVAKVMLTNTMLNVSEIMVRAGFTDLPHFNRTFKQRTGMAPSRFREEHSCL